MKDLKETVAAAKEEGLSYGEYTTRNSPPVEVNVPPGLRSQREKDAEHPPAPPEPEPVPVRQPEGFERTCPHCGKIFRVQTEKSRKKYCSPDCLKDAQYQRFKERQAAKAAEPSKEPEPVRAEPEKRTRITFGDILDLLGRDPETEVVLLAGQSSLTARADSSLWRRLEDEKVVNIGANPEFRAIDVFLEETP